VDPSVIIPDVNLLVYAYLDTGPYHRGARTWLEDSLNGAEAVGLAPVSVFGFLRLMRIPAKSITDSDASRSPVPGEADHLGA
jgi:predicted nucleic acid-binding protein